MVAIPVYYLLMLFHLVLYLKKQEKILYSCHEGIWVDWRYNFTHSCPVTDELSGKLQAVGAVSMEKEPQVLV